MSHFRIGSRLLAAISAQILRVAGLLTMVLSSGVAATSVTTEYGLPITTSSGGQPSASAIEGGTVAALMEFATAHPAYPAAVLLGFVLFVAGDETPLLGG